MCPDQSIAMFLSLHELVRYSADRGLTSDIVRSR
jgi:hypothetical protein